MSARKLLNGLFILALLLAGTPASMRAAKEPRPLSTDVCGPISTDTTWTLANSPYVVTCDVAVASGVTLTIEPGMVVKLSSWYEDLWVNSTLIADGTSSQPIYFTSINDNAVGGST